MYICAYMYAHKFSREVREEMERARGCESTCIHYDLGTKQVIGVLQLVLCTWVAAIGC